MVGPVVTRMVAPSGAAFITDLIAISPSPPVRFSTMKLTAEQRREVLGEHAADQIAAAAGRERKDDLGERAALRTRGVRHKGETGASGQKAAAVHDVSPIAERSPDRAPAKSRRSGIELMQSRSRLSPIARRRRA